MKKATLLWIDLEMTGLVPGKDKILEVAALATDWDLNEIASQEAVVKVDEKIIKDRMVGEFWEKNSEARDGLIAQNSSGKSAKAVETLLLDFLDEYFEKQSIKTDSRGKGKIILAGNSIHQDRKFIDLEFPKLSQRLHYRMLDVSAWKVYFEGALHQKFAKREAHRALDDIQGSIEELKFYLSFMKESK
ncbi:oligoribonuclease [Candidatus Saccharibacteria bacterium]|nr:oligoribonuclease [Candidatus Saccharibacteria bacterium]MBQ9017113.1 oligoribonuclease [Candidatus Saccharibacteria bacterium]